ncbi:MAG: cation:proton antiporter [Kofleriaceae bacterium]|nr:cation:proton antiporter [Kofleriaceae bacterium]MCL4225555.1 cation:proton antiporter [Myxococcales bacterium]
MLSLPLASSLAGLSSLPGLTSPDALVAVSAAGGVSPLVRDLGLCLVAAGLLSAAFVKLRIPAIAALLVAGVVLGPEGLEAVGNRANVETIAGLGLTLLLFVIGLEINLGSLLASGRTLIVTGVVQVPLTIAMGAGLFLLVGMTGWSLVGGGYTALYLGVACGFSSTLLVVKYLHEHLLLDTVSGRLCVGLLIFQDIWAIIFLALQPSFAEPSIAPIAATFAGTAIVGVLAVVVARYVLNHAFHAVARSPELVVTVALAWCFGVGLFGANLGTIAHELGLDLEISVSMEMGALIAGATIATSPYAYEVVSRVVHLRDFFVTLFFVGLGMSIPIPDSAEVLLLAALVAVVAVALRGLLFLPVLYATGLDRRNSVNVSAKLAQVSEFCLVIAYLGVRLGHIDGTQVSVAIFAFVITALLTPLLFATSDRLYLRLRGVMDRLGMRSRGQRADAEDGGAPRLVLLGFHRVSSALLADLERLHPDLVPETLIIDTNAKLHDEIRKHGAQVVYGDIAAVDVLRHAGVDAAKVIVSTVPDELLQGVTNEDIVRTVRGIAPDAIIIACCTRTSQAAALRAAGANHVFRPPTEIALGVLPAIYAALNGELASYQEAAIEEHGALEARHEVMD